MSAARRISRLAVGDATINPVVETYSVPAAFVQDDRISEDLPFGSQGGTSVDHLFPVDGEYTIKVLLKRQVYLYIMGMGEPHQLDLRVDGVLVKRFSVGGEGQGMTAPEGFAGNTQGDPAWENCASRSKPASGRWAPRSSGSTGSPKASSSRRRPATPLSPTTSTTATRLWKAS